jgi:hypothetical protein
LAVTALPRSHALLRAIWFLTIEHMTIQRMEHVGIMVDDLAAATEFRESLGAGVAGCSQKPGSAAALAGQFEQSGTTLRKS